MQASDSGKQMTAIFRLRDLPEELQRRVVQLCLPLWSIKLYASDGCESYEFQNAALSTELHDHNEEPPCYIVKQPNISIPLLLVDRQMSQLVIQETRHMFSGIVRFENLRFRGDEEGISNRSFRSQALRAGAQRRALLPFLQSTSMVLLRVQGILVSQSNLMRLMPNLQNVVYRLKADLYDGYTYGFASQQFLIQNIQAQALLNAFQSSRKTNLEFLFRFFKKSIMAEAQFSMGSGNMQFQFICLFRLCEREDSGFNPVVTERFTLDEWNRLDDLQKISRYMNTLGKAA